MIATPPESAPAKANARLRLRRYLLLAFAAVIVLAFIGRGVAAYRVAHVPYRSVIVPRPYPSAGQSVDGITFSPDGNTLFVADTQTGVSLWHLPRLTSDRRFTHSVSDGISSISWTLKGNMVVVGDNSKVRRWSVNHDICQEMPTPQLGFVRASAKQEYWNVFQLHTISPSGNLAAGANAEGDTVIWDIPTAHRLFYANALPSGKSGPPTNFCDIAFSPDERQAAITSVHGDDSVAVAPLDIAIRSASTGRLLRTWQWKQAYLIMVDDRSGGDLGETGLTFSSDGTMLATADDNKVALWDVQKGTLKKTLAVSLPSGTGAFGGRKRLVFFDGNRLLAGIGWGAVIPVWDVQTGKLLQTFYGEYIMEALAASPDGRWLATGEEDKNFDGKLELWDVSRLLR